VKHWYKVHSYICKRVGSKLKRVGSLRVYEDGDLVLMLSSATHDLSFFGRVLIEDPLYVDGDIVHGGEKIGHIISTDNERGVYVSGELSTPEEIKSARILNY